MPKQRFKNVKFLTSVAKLEQCPQNQLPEVVLAGRSNAGKSSLINSLSGNKKMAKVSQTPGKTQLLVYFSFDDAFMMTDLPGYGFSMSGHEKKKNFSHLADHYFESPRPIDLVFLMLDIRHEPSAQDQLMFEYLQAKNLPFCILLAKCDKLSRAGINKQKAMILKKLKLSSDFPAFCISNTHGIGIDELSLYLYQRYIGKREEVEQEQR